MNANILGVVMSFIVFDAEYFHLPMVSILTIKHMAVDSILAFPKVSVDLFGSPQRTCLFYFDSAK